MPVTRKYFRSTYMERSHTPRVISKVARTLVEQYPVHAARHNLRDIGFATESHPSGVDTFVGTGLSGALVLPRLTAAFRRAGYDMNYLLVRKDGDSSHSFYNVEGSIGNRWLFVADLIESGWTIERVIKEVDRVSDAQLAGIFLYGTGADPAGWGNASLMSASQSGADYSRDETTALYEVEAFRLSEHRVWEPSEISHRVVEV